jgi:hypothetical protein
MTTPFLNFSTYFPVAFTIRPPQIVFSETLYYAMESRFSEVKKVLWLDCDHKELQEGL